MRCRGEDDDWVWDLCEEVTVRAPPKALSLELTSSGAVGARVAAAVGARARGRALAVDEGDAPRVGGGRGGAALLGGQRRQGAPVGRRPARPRRTRRAPP